MLLFTDVPRSRLVKYPLLLRSIAKSVSGLRLKYNKSFYNVVFVTIFVI